MCKHYKTIKQEHTKIVLCCFVWKGNQSFVLSYHIPLCCVPLTSTLFCSWTAVHVYFASLCLTQQNFSAWTDSACRVCGSCSICVDMRGSYVDRISTNIANCILSTVQPQPISLHGSLILCVPLRFRKSKPVSRRDGKMSRVHWAHVVIVVLLSLVQTAPQRLDEWQAMRPAHRQ